jgi:lipopolysaccharide exporter
VTEPPPERRTADLSRHTLAGLQWTYLGTTVGAVLQFGMTAVLARLLTPTAFGLIALAGLFLRFVEYFAKAGITQALVQKATLTRSDIRAGFTLSAGFGLAFAALALVAAPLAGQFARDPELIPVLRWLSLGIVLNGFGAPAVALLRRQLRFKPLALIEIGAYVVGYIVVGFTMALAGAGVYALVGAMLTQTATKAVGTYAMVRHPLLPTVQRSSLGKIFSFGARVSVVSFLEFLQSNLDTLAVGRWAGANQLGLYNRANLLADLPAYHLSSGLSKVLLPSFSAIQHEHRRLREAYLSAVGMTAAIILPLNAGMAVAAPEIILVVLGPQWTGAIQVMPWLLLASSIAMTGHFAGIVTEAQGALNGKMLIAAVSTVTLVIFLILARDRPLSAYGAALAASALVSHLGYVGLLTRTLGTTFRVLLRPFGPAVLGAALVAGTIAGTRAGLVAWTEVPVVIILVAEVVVGAIALAAAFRIGPLRPFRAELARRLYQSGLVFEGGGLKSRTIRFFVGPPGKVPR